MTWTNSNVAAIAHITRKHLRVKIERCAGGGTNALINENIAAAIGAEHSSHSADAGIRCWIVVSTQWADAATALFITRGPKCIKLRCCAPRGKALADSRPIAVGTLKLTIDRRAAQTCEQRKANFALHMLRAAAVKSAQRCSTRPSSPASNPCSLCFDSLMLSPNVYSTQHASQGTTVVLDTTPTVL